MRTSGEGARARGRPCFALGSPRIGRFFSGAFIFPLAHNRQWRRKEEQGEGRPCLCPPFNFGLCFFESKGRKALPLAAGLTALVGFSCLFFIFYYK
jgi:hypothetical protein